MLQVFLWQRAGWTSVHGPMVAAGFHRGEEQPDGYDRKSFLERREWKAARPGDVRLGGEALVRGEATGILLGGCLTLLQATLGTPWSLDTRGAILLIEDSAVKPYQLDRMLLHLAQAGKFRGVRGIVLGEFPESRAACRKQRDRARRLPARIRQMGIPVIFGAAFGHTHRPMLTLPLGVRARLTTGGEGNLEILEPAVQPAK